jgi:hypothetical protein
MSLFIFSKLLKHVDIKQPINNMPEHHTLYQQQGASEKNADGLPSLLHFERR